LRERYGAGAEPWQGVEVLSDLLARGQGRAPDARLTIFKGMGMGLSDLALARVVYQAACERDLGQRLAPQTRENLLLSR
ncbi:ornithine cyclodeaminase family protein, partial [Bordetella avium]